MLSTQACRTALLAAVEATNLFKDVQHMTLERIQDLAFFKSLPSLKVPAAILIWKGRDDESQGAAKDRTTHWSLISVFRNVKGNSLEDNLAAVDILTGTTSRRFLDQQLLDDELTILGTHKVGVAMAPEAISVLEIAFETREASER